MNHLDTNIILRLLTGEPLESAEKAAALVADAQAHGRSLFVCSVVVYEAYFVLVKKHGQRENEVVKALHGLLSAPPFVCASGVREILAAYRGTGAGLADRLILAEAQADGGKLLTMDRALGRLEGAKFVG